MFLTIFTKEAAAQTWCHEIYGIGILGPFTQKYSHPMLIPDPAMKRGIGRRQTRRIQNGMDESDVGKKKKKLQLVWRRRSHLQEVPTTFSTHCYWRGWTFRESDGWIGSTYKNSPHLVVHVTTCNVFVCMKLNILCICLEFGCNEWNLQCNMLCGILFNVPFIFRSLYLMWYCIINIIITIKHSKHISIAIKGTGVPS